MIKNINGQSYVLVNVKVKLCRLKKNIGRIWKTNRKTSTNAALMELFFMLVYGIIITLFRGWREREGSENERREREVRGGKE